MHIRNIKPAVKLFVPLGHYLSRFILQFYQKNNLHIMWSDIRRTSYLRQAHSKRCYLQRYASTHLSLALYYIIYRYRHVTQVKLDSQGRTCKRSHIVVECSTIRMQLWWRWSSSFGFKEVNINWISMQGQSYDFLCILKRIIKKKQSFRFMIT